VIAKAKASAKGWLRSWQTRMAIKQFDHAFFCTNRDRQVFGLRSASILPNIVDASDFPPDQRAGQTVLIVGSLWYAPNRVGVEWFLDECWPAIARRVPALTLRIVGQADPADRRRWERHPRTEVPGFVDDLASEYSRSLFAVAPVHHGGGTCIKFLEAASYRRPCVITRHTYEGYRHHFHDGQATLVARDAADMVRSCVMLAEDEALRAGIADRAHGIVRQFYTADSFDAAVEAVVRPMLGGR